MRTSGGEWLDLGALSGTKIFTLRAKALRDKSKTVALAHKFLVHANIEATGP